ncbi:MAG: TraR/DksA C4-type zinc finger protein [Candidatus Nealsonbacteria bacterium]
MNKKLLSELKEKLEQQKKDLKSELQNFAKEDVNVKGDWDTKYPQVNGGSGGQMLEDAADQVEEYSNLLPVEHNLELRLQSTNKALDNMKKGKYGKCDKCGKNISEERLKVYPEAEKCTKCHG